jgi:hypothetical protein
MLFVKWTGIDSFPKNNHVSSAFAGSKVVFWVGGLKKKYNEVLLSGNE